MPINKEKFDSILIAMAEVYDQTLSEERLSLYYEALKDMSFEEFQIAANKVARTSRFFPKPVDFRESVMGSIEDKALEALTLVEDAMRRVGQYKTVVFPDKVIHMVVEALNGWERCCSMDTENEWKWVRKEFIALYKVFAANPKQYPEKLIGYHERLNTVNRHLAYIQEPVLIGNEHTSLVQRLL